MLLEFLRNLAMGAIADEVRKTPQGQKLQEEYAKPVAETVVDTFAPVDTRASSVGTQLDAQGYPTNSPMLEAQTAPYRPNASFKAEPISPYEMQDMARMAAGEQQSRQGELDQLFAAENAQNAQRVQDNVRMLSEGAGAAATSPYQRTNDSSAMMQPTSGDRITETAKRLQQEVPQAKPEETIAMATVEEIQKEAFNQANTQQEDPNKQVSESSFFSDIGSGLQSFFGDEAAMLALARSFNSLRHQPDQALGAALSKRLDAITTQRGENKTAQALLKSKDPRMKKVGELMTASNGRLSYKDALAATKPTDFEKQLSLVGGNLDAWKTTFGKKGDTINIGGEGSEGLKQVDKGMGDEYTKFVTKGGRASAARNLGTLRTVIDDIKAGKNLSGTLIGLAPEQGLNFFAPEAKAARDRVAGVIQQSLKETLGAQFTEKEAQQLINRAYDPALDESENLARLEALAMMIEATLKAKEHAMAHYSKKFTMLGYDPAGVDMPTEQDFYDAMNRAVARKSPVQQAATGADVGTVKTFTTRDGKTAEYKKIAKGADSDPSTWELVK